MNSKKIIASLLLAGVTSTALARAPITYTDWTSASGGGTIAGTASGTMTLSSGAVNVSYSGELAFAQVNNGGTQFWTQPNSLSLPYTGNALVGNAPATTDIIALQELGGPYITDTVTFSQAVLDPIMLINSLGQGGVGVSYLFNQPFNLLSAGQGYWGGDSTTLTSSGNTLTGFEGAGAIEFLGEVTSISWTTEGGEYWNGFTIGATTAQTAGVPDGGTTVGLLGMAVSGLLGWRRNK
jgi:hypothetical protein